MPYRSNPEHFRESFARHMLPEEMIRGSGMTRCGLWLVLIGLLSGCGSSSPTGMKVSCTGGTSIQPLTRLELRQVPPTTTAPATATLSYPDPLHSDQTGTLTLGPGERCSVAPATQT